VSNLIFPDDSPGLRVNFSGPGSENLAAALSLSPQPLDESDLAIFCVSAVVGFAPGTTENWQRAREIYLPSIVAIVDLEKSEIDFEDMSAIVGKTLDPVVTPYLVLHSDEGFPTAVISLETQMITDYTLGLKRTIESEPEHKELVAEFREEFLEQIESAGDEPFLNALIFPAIPLALHIKLGLAEIQEWLNKIPGRS
jgi:translation elongation factor EF-G